MARQRKPSERESELRRHYLDHFCPAANEFQNPLYQKSHVDRDPDSGELVGELTIEQDPEFPVWQVASAIKDVVRGEEDADGERYRRGAELLLKMDKKYEIRHPIYLMAMSVYSPRAQDLPMREGVVMSRDGETPMPELRFSTTSGGKSTEASDELRRLAAEHADDPKFVASMRSLAETFDGYPVSKLALDSSFLLFSTFMDYLGDHRRYFDLGVCHNCGRLYVKTKGKRNMRYCAKKCWEAHRYQQRKRAKRST